MADRTHRTNYDIRATDNASLAFNKVRSAMEGVDKTGAGLKKLFAGGIIGATAASFATAIVKEAKEAEQASARLGAVLKATGAAAGVSKSQLDEMAESLAAATQFDDESFRNAQAALLKFGNIQGNVFKEGLKLSADLAAFMGTDVPEAAQMIGKSLQSPTEGITMMERQFGKLTEAQERQIQKLVAEGKAVEAQNAVLDIWRAKIGGTAEAMNTGLTKATSDVTKSWKDMLEAIGRTDTFTTVAAKGLGMLASILRDIEGLAKNDPLKPFEEQLKGLNDVIQRLEDPRGRAKGRNPLLEGKIAELKEQRDALEATVRAAKTKDQDPFAFDPTSLDVQLGGDAKDAKFKAALQGMQDQLDKAKELKVEEEVLLNIQRQRYGQLTEAQKQALILAAREIDAEKDKKFRLEKAIELDETAQENKLGASEALKNVDIANAKKRQEALEQTTRALIESAEIEQDRIDGLVFTYDKFGRKIELLKEDFDELEAQQNRGINIGRELGLTFTSAFEDAVIAGKELDEVIKAIGQDIERLILRKLVTEPAADAIAQGLKGFSFGAIFGGGSGPEQLSGPGRASGGSVMAGQPYTVGEEGPELFIPGQSGRIVPNGAWGGGRSIVFNNVYNVSSGATEAQLRGMLAASERRTISAVMERRAR